MKVLILGLNYAPESVGIAPYTTELAEYLAGAGHEVEVIVGEPYYPRWQRFADPPPHGHIVERGVGVHRCRHYIPPMPTGARRILHHVSFALTALLPTIATALRMRPEVVITVTPSLASIPVAWLAARLSGAKLWGHVQDFEIEAAFATGLLFERSLPGRIARMIEHKCLKLADRISSISPQMVARLHHVAIPEGRTYQLRNWAKSNTPPDAAEAQRFRDEWRLGARKVALYSGSIANKQGIDIIVAAARRLRNRDDIVFVICGQGPTRAKLRLLSEGLDNVQLRDLQPEARLGGLLGLATIHLLPQIPEAADLVLPSKLSNMLASGRAIVATADPGTGIAQEVEGCGIVTAPGDAAALAQAVALLVDDPVLAEVYGRSGERRARERWCKSEILGNFAIELDRFVRKAAPAADPALVETLADVGQRHRR